MQLPSWADHYPYKEAISFHVAERQRPCQHILHFGKTFSIPGPLVPVSTDFGYQRRWRPLSEKSTFPLIP